MLVEERITLSKGAAYEETPQTLSSGEYTVFGYSRHKSCST